MATLFLISSRSCDERSRPAGCAALPWAAPGDSRSGRRNSLQVDHQARLQIMLAGRQMTAFSHLGRRVERTLRAGDAAFWCPDAWTVRPFTQSFHYLGLIYRPGFIRLIEIDNHPGDPQVPIRHYHSLGAPSGPVEDLLRALNACAEDGDETKQDLLRAALAALVLATAHYLEQERRGARRPGRRELTWQRVHDYIDERHRDAGLDRERAAGALELNPTYISDLCAAHSGMAFNAYVRSVRIRRASDLLATSDLTVAAVAQQTGFASAGYFIKSFRRETGETPGCFRARRGLCPPRG